MAAPDWVSYVGAITGIAGSLMGYFNYRRSSQHKVLDLRLDLRKKEADVQLALASLPGLLDRANESRLRVMAATGRNQSGAMAIWESEVAADRVVANELKAALPTEPKDYSPLNQAELEGRLVEIHSLEVRTRQLSEKFRSALAADDRERDQLREDMRARHPAR